jgi:tRNA (cytidine/uridine-2'-O-)-methyltransferase
MHVVLLEPEIPPNTGNIARLCAATHTILHLVEPLGFRMDDRELKRAGMDYWAEVKWHRWPSWDAFLAQAPAGARLWMVEAGGPRLYSDVSYQTGDILVFGRETAGLPRELLDRYPDTCVSIPMFNPRARSLNLANCVAVVLFEALRQQEFPGTNARDNPSTR